MADVLVDGVSVGAVTTYDFTDVTADHTISSHLRHRHLYDHRFSWGQRLRRSCTAITTVNYGGSQSYAITPDLGYHVADVLVDGVSVGRRQLPTTSTT